ncbi:inorganic triphosphatase [Pseudocolwellia agarivorans]|uniref:CYTH domain-containing protein n=1 Tax=Pseudocolwellia agarivorans TaxID=1911682 RepID=UPI0009872D59|nr:CYTH and CHAD domain-containing protein [Pseudocolwellia agarivorans]
MAIEIELKYLVFSDNTADIISTLLSKQKIDYIESVTQLGNCYFDTPDLNLRKHDMGLRIREKDGMLEQTIKTAGKLIGGLQQRPEFNVPITVKQPQLDLFPAEIWKPTQNLENIQNQLVSLFSTDFERHIWLINTAKGGVVEVVFDQGEVSSNGLVDPICEIELELVRGELSELFDLAELFLTELELRPGLNSKAARGYGLWNETKTTSVCSPLALLPLNQNENISEAFLTGLTSGLNHLQKSVEHYIDEPSLSDLAVIKDTLALMEHGFIFFEEYLLEELTDIKNEITYFVGVFSWVEHLIYLKEIVNKTGNYRKKLDYSAELVTELKLEKRRFPNIDEVKQVFHSQRFNQLQLNILKLLMPNQKLFSSSAVNINILTFATNQLSKSLDDLVKAMSEAMSLTSEQYLEQSSLLNISLHTGIWFAALFNEEERSKYRAPWLDIREGITELQVLWLIQQQLQRLPEQPAKLMNWQKSKVDNLLHALDHSKHSAMSLVPYWL